MAYQFVDEKVLTQLVLDYEPEDLGIVWNQLVSPMKVGQPAGIYYTYPRFSNKLVDDQVAIKSESGRMDTGRLRSEEKFATVAHSLKDLITDKEIKFCGGIFDLVVDAAYELKKRMALTREVAVAAMVAACGNDTPAATHWDADSGTTIEKDFRVNINAFEDAVGVSPNVAIIPKAIWDVMVMDPVLREVWQLIPATADRSKIQLSSLVNLLFDNFSKVLIPRSKYDNSAKGKTETLVDIWDTNAVSLFYVANAGGMKKFTWATQFMYQDWVSKQWSEVDPEGVWVRVQYEDSVDVVCSAACRRITAVLDDA